MSWLHARRRWLRSLLSHSLLAGAWATPTWSRSTSSPSPLLPGEQAEPLALGNTTVHLLARGDPQAPVLLLNLHENERSSVQAAHALLQAGPPELTRQLRLLRLQAQGERLVAFQLAGRRYRFDPNRIFSGPGTERTLKNHGSYTPAAAAALQPLRTRLMAELTRPGLRTVLALHNNGRGRYDLREYQRGGNLAADAEAVQAAPGVDPGDFFLVTQRAAFERLVAAGHSVVLQGATARDDGSLSVRLHQGPPLYVNVEARHGHLAQQQAMLASALRVLG